MFRFRDIYSLDESKLSSKQRNAIDSKEFGLPSQRRYTLNYRANVIAAIRLFNHV